MSEKFPMNNLQPGDLILFASDPDSPISNLIAVLTGYPVSHSAVVYKTAENTVPQMLEAGFEGVQPGDVNHYGQRGGYIRRLKDAAQLDFVPFVTVAESYIGRPYGFLNLAFIGLYILVTDNVPGASSPVMKALLKAAIYAIQTAIKEKIKPGSGNSLVCSEFVYHAFADTAVQTKNDAYRIKLSNQKKCKAVKKSKAAQQSLLAHICTAENISTVVKNNYTLLSGGGELIPNAENACRILLKARESTTLLHQFFTRFRRPVVDNDLNQLAEQFIAALAQIPGINLSTAMSGQELQERIIDIYAAFVTPADILNAENVDDLGELDYNA